MKHFFTLAAFVLIAVSAKATIVTITCQNTPAHFLPVTVNAVCGDTIRWVWVVGTHIVGPISSADIPVGAAMWVAPIDVGNTSFQYVVTVAGNYHYVCHPATPHGEDGYIVVTCPSGVQEYTKHLSSVYPNPFTDRIFIETATHMDQISIYNLVGVRIRSFPVKSGQTKFEIDLATLPEGVFFYSIMNDGAVLETWKIIKQE